MDCEESTDEDSFDLGRISYLLTIFLRGQVRVLLSSRVGCERGGVDSEIDAPRLAVLALATVMEGAPRVEGMTSF